MIAFGLDLAGYSGGHTGFARAETTSGGAINVTVYAGHPFARKIKGHDPIAQQNAEERAWVAACCERGALLVDVPIDRSHSALLSFPHVNPAPPLQKPPKECYTAWK